jgi:uracil-DNA glycosylase
MRTTTCFELDCIKCRRLDNFLTEIKQKYPQYHARPVAPFGAKNPDLLVVGLAPGMHGANATGRPFTGDYAGLLLYATLHKFGYSNKPTSESSEDGLELYKCRITNAVKCLPPQNKPTGDEIIQCNAYLAAELAQLPEKTVILALGGIAHKAVLRAYGLKLNSAVFAHNVTHELPNGRYLVDSYHCSRYNIQTKRLTTSMFEDVFRQIQVLKSGHSVNTKNSQGQESGSLLSKTP